ncbi:hypothetical protein MMC06_001541 [Schaereria dolodes]|nr:hypothetical protein [Schaereria dolodes]
MLLTLKPPLQNGYKSPHAYDYSPPQPPSLTTFSPTLSGGSLPPLPDNRPRRMSTPHRGLPPPSAMTLPNPDRGPTSVGQSMGQMGQLPAPPSQWQGADESMRNWLQAKAEEDRRRQEEERTKQETLRLEQRKIEQNILRDSLQGGVPPHMVPMVFAGMGGGNLANASLEWAQHYMAQISLQQQAQLQQQQQQPPLPPQQSQASPEGRRDARMIAGPQPNPYAQQLTTTHGTTGQSGQQLQSQAQSSTGFVPSYQVPASSNERRGVSQQTLQAAPPTSAPRPPPQSALPRLNTGEMQIQVPPPGGLQIPGQHPLQQAQTTQQQEQQSSSPSIYFHHWVPPSSQAGPKDPPTPSGKSQHESPYSQAPASHLRSEYTHSPKKRKVTGTHHPAPSASSNPPETSPSFSQTSSAGRRRAHSNQRSDASSRGAHEALGPLGSRPASRHRHPSTSEAESGNLRQASAQPETHQFRDSAGPEKRRTDGGTPKREPEGPS